MGCRVPDFVLEDGDPAFAGQIPAPPGGEDFGELIWRKGAVFFRGLPEVAGAPPAVVSSRVEPFTSSSGVSPHAAGPAGTHALFIGEDEMASWLCWPPEGDDSGPVGTGGFGGASNPEQPRDAARPERDFPGAAKADGPAAFRRPPRHPETRSGRTACSAAPPPRPAAVESTAAESSLARRGGSESRSEGGACEHGMASASGVSYEEEADEDGDSEAAAAAMAAGGGERKRRAREEDDDDSDSHGEDAEFDSGGRRRRRRRRPAPAGRARAAEVHNLSERRRRDRINEKMKALQQLIPRCNKTDKASMLDDAIEYMKSLQMQVQMMSVCCGMGPVMFHPGMQRYMSSSMGMGFPMGMGTAMAPAALNAGLAMMAFPPVLPAAQMAAKGTADGGQAMPLQPVHAPIAAAAAGALADQMKLEGDRRPAAATPSMMPNLSGLRRRSR